MATKTANNPSEHEKFPLVKTRYIRAMDVNIEGGAYEIHFSNSTKWTAKECVVYPGVRRVSTIVSNGEYKEIEHDIYDGRTGRSTKIWSDWQNFFNHNNLLPQAIHELFPESSDSVYVGLQPPPWPKSSDSRDRETMGLSIMATWPVQLFFQELFHGSVATFSDNLGFFTGVGNEVRKALSSASAGAAQDVLQAILYGDLARCSPARDPMECAMENTVKALTKTFRDASFVEHGYQKAKMTVGKTLVDQTRVMIQWPWLFVPLLVWLLSVGLWSATVWRTWKRGMPMWRNNPLPLLSLYRPIDEDACRTDGNTSSLAYTRRMRGVLGQLYASKAVKEPRLE
jgi:hypothetical protein